MRSFPPKWALTLAVALPLGFHAMAAETWLHLTTGYEPKCIIRTAAGGVAYLGNTNGFLSSILVAEGADGGTLWQKEYDASNNDSLYSLAELSAGGFLAVGSTTSVPPVGHRYPWLLRLDGDGNILWQKSMTTGYDAMASSVVVGGDGNFLVAGMTRPGYSSSDPYNAFLAKVTPSGTLLWFRTYGGSGDERFSKVVPYGSGYAVLGNQKDAPLNSKVNGWVVGVDGSGGILWQRSFGISTSDTQSADILATSDGGILLALSIASGPFGARDAWLVKLDPVQATQWQIAYGGSRNDFPRAVAETSGGFVLAGDENSWVPTTPPYVPPPDLWLFKVDGSGGLAWQKAFRLPDDWGGVYTYSSGLVTCADGGFLLQGFSSSFRSMCSGPLLLKLDGSGDLGPPCVQTRITEATGSTTSAGTSPAILSSAASIPLVATGATASGFSSERKECRPESTVAPSGDPTITVEEIGGCADRGVRITWPPDPTEWGDGGSGDRTYDVRTLETGLIAPCLPYGTTSFVDDFSLNETPYSYFVRYSNGGDLLLDTAGVSASDHAPYPTDPPILAGDLDPMTDTGVLVTWTAPGDWNDGSEDPSSRLYLIYRNGELIAGPLSPSLASYTDSGGPNNMECYYEVSAVNACGNETRSMGCPASDQVAPPGEASGAGHGLTALRGAGTAVEVTYAPAACASAHTVYWGLGDPAFPSANWMGAACIDSASGWTSFDPGDAPEGLFCYFVVVGNNRSEEGSYGRDSGGMERQPAWVVSDCMFPQNLTGNCP